MAEPRRHYRQWAPDATALNLLGDRWTLLIIRELIPGRLRRAELARRLGHVGTHLDRRLAQMEADGLVLRFDHGTPKKPCVEYELTEMGYDALQVIAALARFGQRNACWRRPELDQMISLRSLFTLLPALVVPDVNVRLTEGGETTVLLQAPMIDASDDPHGVARMRAQREAGNAGIWTLTITHSAYLVMLRDESRSLADANAYGNLLLRADAAITALPETWIECVAVGATRGFTITGDDGLADDIIDVLTGSDARSE